MIAIAKPWLGEEEKKAVNQVLSSGMIACGAVTSEFEQAFAAYIGAQHGIATTSGTTALEVALRALKIGKGDKVLTTPFSFIASTNAIVYVGATPVFADIDESTFNLSPKAIEKALEQHPDIKALLIVHLFGQPCDMDAIMKIVKAKGLLLIEDCAQSHGALWNGKKAGSFGDVSAFSFYPTKNMTTTEGGMVLTSDETIAKKARMLINHGMQVRYYHDEIGYNYRMTNMAAAIGLCQLKKLDSFNAKRQETAAYYNANIKNPLMETPASYEKGAHVYHQYTVKIREDKRDAFIAHLDQNGIGYGVFYPLSIPEQRCYIPLGINTPCPVTDLVKKQVVSLPVHPQLTAQEAEAVAQCVNSFRG